MAENNQEWQFQLTLHPASFHLGTDACNGDVVSQKSSHPLLNKLPPHPMVHTTSKIFKSLERQISPKGGAT